MSARIKKGGRCGPVWARLAALGLIDAKIGSIAKMADVSNTTVYRVLFGADRPVSEKTRRRIYSSLGMTMQEAEGGE